MANDDTLDFLRSIARGETTSQMREIEEGFGLFGEPYREGDCLKEERAVQKYRKKLASIVKSRKTGIHKILKKCKNDDATDNDYAISYLRGCETALEWVLETLKWDNPMTGVRTLPLHTKTIYKR